MTSVALYNKLNNIGNDTPDSKQRGGERMLSPPQALQLKGLYSGASSDIRYVGKKGGKRRENFMQHGCNSPLAPSRGIIN